MLPSVAGRVNITSQQLLVNIALEFNLSFNVNPVKKKKRAKIDRRSSVIFGMR
jgi:hypothetical protein